MDSITLRKPDDWHCHLRDAEMLQAVSPFTARRFGRVLVMPNLTPEPITNTEKLLSYKKRVEAALGESCKPLMTYYLTDNSSPEEITEGFKSGNASAVKLYSAGVTTHSDQGVTAMENVYPVFETLQKTGMPLLLHGEALRDKNGKEIDEEDREKVFLDTTLSKILKDFPALKIVLEHASSKDAIDFIRNESSARLGATITVHHLMLSSDDPVEDTLRTYVHCHPAIKKPEDRDALRKAVTSGGSYFFLGTDSAPHLVSQKQKTTGYPAGIFTAPAALELYAQVFEEEGKLENLEKFASLHGPAFYGLPPNEEKITLEKNPWTIDELVTIEGGEKIRPFGYHEDPAKRPTINWRLK